MAEKRFPATDDQLEQVQAFVAQQLEADIRANSYKLLPTQAKVAAKAAGRAVDVSAEDFEDADQ